MNILDEIRDTPDNELGSLVRGHMALLYALAFNQAPLGEVVELGVARGRSTRALVSGVVAYNPTMEMTAIDKDPPWESAPAPACGIYYLKGDSVKLASAFLPASVSLLFIDTAHTYVHTLAELEAWFSRMTPHGILCGHDWNDRYKGFGVQPAVREFLDRHPGVYALQTFSHDDGLFVLWPTLNASK